jgi:hypothetical protein
MPTTRVLDYHIYPAALRPRGVNGQTIAVNTDDLGVVATQEMSQTSPVIMGLGLAIHGLLHPGDNLWIWRDKGPGVGREVRRAMSGLMGRFMARWYLKTHHDAGAFIPIDSDAFRVFDPQLGNWFRVARRVGERGDLPDWLWAGMPAAPHTTPCAGFLEAKGTYYRNQIGRSLDGARTQLRQLLLERAPNRDGPWTAVSCKNWAVATGWTTFDGIERGFQRPIMRVEDPETEGEALNPDSAREIAVLPAATSCMN